MVDGNFSSKKWEESDFEIKLTDIKIDASGSIPITWCLSPKVLKWLNGKEAWVLLATTSMTPSGKYTEWRSYVRLTDMLAYVVFQRSGKCKILARITKCKDYVKKWMNRDNGGWADNVFIYPFNDIDKEEIDTWTYPLSSRSWGSCETPGYNSSNPYGTFQLDIPKECFAPEPPAWEKTWVNFFWTNKAVDQCAYRKRRMLAYPWQVIPFLILWSIRLIGAILPYTIGSWNVNWKPIYSPIYNSTFDLWPGQGNWKNIFYIKRLGKNQMGLGIVIPLILWISGIAIWCGNWFLPKVFGVMALAVIFLALILPFLASVKILRSIFKTSINFIDEVITNWWDKRIATNNEIQRKEYEALLCANHNIRTMKDLPKRKRTIRLRFEGIKSKVCKPFAR